MTDTLLTGRPLGQQIRRVVAIVHNLGPCSYRQVSQKLAGAHVANVSKCLSRATSLGLLTTDRTVFPRTFTAVPDWQDRLEDHNTTRMKKYDAPVQSLSKRFSSVWDMAAAMSA